MWMAKERMAIVSDSQKRFSAPTIDGKRGIMRPRPTWEGSETRLEIKDQFRDPRSGRRPEIRLVIRDQSRDQRSV